MKNYFKALGLHARSTPLEIRAKWRSLASKMHPDRNGNTPEANSAFADITEAYSILNNEAATAAYLAKFDLMHKLCPVCGGSGCTRRQLGFTQAVLTQCTTCYGLGRVTQDGQAV